jgi:hypothetical protein
MKRMRSRLPGMVLFATGCFAQYADACELDIPFNMANWNGSYVTTLIDDTFTSVPAPTLCEEATAPSAWMFMALECQPRSSFNRIESSSPRTGRPEHQN